MAAALRKGGLLARVVSGEQERSEALQVALRTWRREHQLEAFVEAAPLIEVLFDDETLLAA